MRHLFLSFSAARNNDKCIRTVRHKWSRCSCIFNKSTTNKDTSLFSLISRSEFNDLVWHRDASTRYIRFQSLRALQSQPLSTKDPPPQKKSASIDTKSMANVYWTQIFILRDKNWTTMKISVGFACMRVRSGDKYTIARRPPIFRWKLWIIFSMGNSVETKAKKMNKQQTHFSSTRMSFVCAKLPCASTN